MNSRTKVLISWSGGKDSARALHEIQLAGNFEVVGLLTTVAQEYDRVSHHGVRASLMQAQAEALGLPLEIVFIPATCSHEDYEATMGAKMRDIKARGVESVVFGDIFLEDLRRHRESKLALVEMSAIFPIWKRPTDKLAQEYLDLGFRSAIASGDSRIFREAEMFMDYNSPFIKGLEGRADPCGENGEFHTFAYDGPIFKRPVSFRRGSVELRDNHFYYCDLIPD